MEMLLEDPTTLPIKEKQVMGLWPPSADNIADSIYPYIKRLKKEKVTILDVGTGLGENAYRLLELDDANSKIEQLYTVNLPVNNLELEKTKQLSIAQKNLEDKDVEFVFEDKQIRNKKFDVVFINADLKNLDTAMVKYYDYCDHNGIYCGNNHHTTHVKEALTKFRRGSKIGTPIQVSNRLCWFWWKR